MTFSPRPLLVCGAAGLLGLCSLLLSAWNEPAAAPPVQAVPTPPDVAAVDFRRDVLPILSGKCFACHGPDVAKGKLRLDRRELAIVPTKSGAIPLQPGQAAASEVLRRVGSVEAAERMPPPKTGQTLTVIEQGILRRWIEQGAAYQTHWAFVAPVRPTLPVVADQGWIKNEIDAFVSHALEQKGIKPSPPAARETLIRRLSFDLRGLPPTLEEVEQFLADASADAYEQLVDRMLSSPHYGEKMAQLWLDLARFADTSGYHKDSTRQMWLWRDGVIEAFNRNQPFDQFTVEQLAGDLLPNATVAQKIASGFHRNTRFNEEGGVDPAEFVVRYHVDRVSTLGQVWLGLSLGCAECHNHKHDPLSQKEFYQLYAFFTGIREPMVSMNHNQPLPPLLHVPSPEQTQALAKLQQDKADLEEAIARELKRVRYTDPGVEAGPTRSQAAWAASAPTTLPAEIKTALQAQPRSERQREQVRAYYLRKVYADARDDFEPLEQELAEVVKKSAEIEAAIPHTLVCEERPDPPATHVLLRGDFQQKGERVERDVPAFLPALPSGAPRNRLGLARWLVRPDHPLTARVTVNRLWAQMFGNGIVRTLGDFGSQSEAPSHPELLDWLAREFVESGWDVKALLKRLALSNAYQQASTYRQEKADPDNRLLYRANRARLGAEEVRDNALAIAGLLNRKVGGPSRMPYQPDDYYKGRFEEWPWQTSRGDEQHRRGLYTFWRRTALHPMFALFDAPTREECSVSRPRTNTPLQALATLNDPTFVEAARVFAERILTQGSIDREGRLAFAFRIALGRPPEAAERRVLEEHYMQQHARYRQDREAAAKLVNVGTSPRSATLDVAEHAAWTAVASIVLNLDETITRE